MIHVHRNRWPIQRKAAKDKFCQQGIRLGLPPAFLMAPSVKNLLAMRETWVRSLSWEDPLAKGKATHSSIVAWRIQRVRHDWATFTFIDREWRRRLRVKIGGHCWKKQTFLFILLFFLKFYFILLYYTVLVLPQSIYSFKVSIYLWLKASTFFTSCLVTR